MLGGTGRWRRKFTGFREFFREVASDFSKRAKFHRRHRLEQHVFAVSFNQYFRGGKTKGLREADGLASSMTKYLGGDHSYIT